MAEWVKRLNQREDSSFWAVAGRQHHLNGKFLSMHTIRRLKIIALSSVVGVASLALWITIGHYFFWGKEATARKFDQIFHALCKSGFSGDFILEPSGRRHEGSFEIDHQKWSPPIGNCFFLHLTIVTENGIKREKPLQILYIFYSDLEGIYAIEATPVGHRGNEIYTQRVTYHVTLEDAGVRLSSPFTSMDTIFSIPDRARAGGKDLLIRRISTE